MGKTHSKPSAARHGHGMLCVNRPLHCRIPIYTSRAELLTASCYDLNRSPSERCKEHGMGTIAVPSSMLMCKCELNTTSQCSSNEKDTIRIFVGITEPEHSRSLCEMASTDFLLPLSKFFTSYDLVVKSNFDKPTSCHWPNYMIVLSYICTQCDPQF
jgi:hypothetical protein